MANLAYQFGDFILDASARELILRGEPVNISSRAFDILSHLVANPASLVLKTDLLATVWPDSFVGEGNLAVHMSAIRRALERGGGRSFIKTVSGRGYTFVAPVRNLETFPAQAIKFFEEAIRLEPGPALAHTGIGMTHVAMYNYGFCGRETAYEAALRSVRTALDADRGSSQAFVLKASVYSMFDRLQTVRRESRSGYRTEGATRTPIRSCDLSTGCR